MYFVHSFKFQYLKITFIFPINAWTFSVQCFAHDCSTVTTFLSVSIMHVNTFEYSSRDSVVAFANFPNELITGRGSVRASNFGRAVHAKGDVSTREERRGWEHWSVLLRSINGAVIRECINNFGIINSRIILRERSWLETLPAALPRKQDYILYRVRLCLHKDATWTYHGLGIGKRIVDQSNNFPFLYFLFSFFFVKGTLILYFHSYCKRSVNLLVRLFFLSFFCSLLMR